MDGVTPEQSRDFYRAAAHFYRKAPWRSVAEGETIEVECEQLEGGPWYAVILDLSWVPPGRPGAEAGI